MNPLISMTAKQANNNTPLAQMIKQFAEFKKQWTPKKAQAKIDEMLESGQINAQQLEQAKQMAQQMQGLLGGK